MLLQVKARSGTTMSASRKGVVLLVPAAAAAALVPDLGFLVTACDPLGGMLGRRIELVIFILVAQRCCV